ncbi:hypothetical protein D3C83_106470 [compost metagenome]
MRQVIARLMIDSNAKRFNTAAMRFDQCLPRVFNAVFAAVVVAVIVRLAVGERNQQLGARIDGVE